MKKLWQKNWNLNEAVEAFETKDDIVLDQKLVIFDVLGSYAHAKGLERIGYLNHQELQLLKKGLTEILILNNNGKFQLTSGDEDIHTKIENFLTEKYGVVGKKIHTGRSRNDQVLVALRLYSKNQLLHIWESLLQLSQTFLILAQKYEKVVMPGYTHMQKAMPSSVGMWAGAFTEGLLDDLIILKAAYTLNNQSPLGSAAGYGVPLPLDRHYSTQLLGFEKVQNNALYCQNSRGKIEGVLLSALIAICFEINKFSTDVLLFTTTEFNFFDVAKELCSGSSIMPQKKNVDVAELLQSKIHVVLGNYTQLISVSSNLISGYNRGLQDSKKPFMESLEITHQSLIIASMLIHNTKINKEALAAALTPELCATHYALSLVKQGIPFREAYQKTAEVIAGAAPFNTTALLADQTTHQGGLGNLGLQHIAKQLTKEQSLYTFERNKFISTLNKLLPKGGEYL